MADGKGANGSRRTEYPCILIVVGQDGSWQRAPGRVLAYGCPEEPRFRGTCVARTQLLVRQAFLPAYFSYFAQVFVGAADSITFPSENRSTRLRIIMLGQQLLLIVPAAAGVMLLVQLAVTSRELRQVRVAAPQRVEPDDAELHPSPPPSGPRNPWEES